MPRDERRDVERAEQLDRFWDEVVLGAEDPIPVDGPDLASAEVVRRLNTLPGAPGSAAARAHVWQRLLDHDPTLAREVTLTPLRGAGQSSSSPNGRVSMTVSRPAPTQVTTVRRFWPLLEFAASAALILGMLGLLGGYLTESRVLPKMAAPWQDPDVPAVPMARGGPARTGEMPGPAPEGVPDARWQVGTGATTPSSPMVVDGVVYVGTYDRTLLALDAATGTERWRFTTDGAIGGSPAVADGVVYVGDEARVLYAVHADTGEQRWRVDLGDSLYTAAPAVVDGTVYLTSGAGGTAPAVVDGIVYAGGDGSASRSPLRVHAIDAASGQERWRHAVAADGLFALDATTGEEQWYFTTTGPVYHSSPVVANGTVYVGSKDGNVYAVDATTGAERWRFTTGNAVYASPAVVDEIVYVGSTDGFLYALDAATGEQRWRLETGVVQRSAPAVVDDVVYIVGGNLLWAVDAATGSERWQVATGGNGEGSPAVVGGTIYVGGAVPPDGSGVLVALSDLSEP